MSSDAITSVIYDEKDPIFLKIREKFKEKLTTLFSCEDYDQIIKYIFDGVFKDKTPKKKCIIDFEPIFKDKTNQLMGFLWDLAEKTVNESKNNIEEQDENQYNSKSISRKINRNGNYQRGNLRLKGERMRIGNKEVILHNNRTRSRSNSNNNYNDDEYQGNYQRGFYNQRGRYTNMMPMGGRGGFGFYPIMPPYIQRPFYSSKTKHPKPKEQTAENPVVENAKAEEKDPQQQNEEKQQDEHLIDTEAFKKMTPEEQKSILEKREAKKKIRCKNWPNCKDPNCQYTHPTQTCPYFPNCMFGDKCSYIHPNIPCKYGFYCTRIGCSYSHPAGWNPGMGMFPNVMHPIPYKGKKKPVVANEEVKDNNVEGSEQQKVEEGNNQQVVQSEEKPPVQDANDGVQQDNQQEQ